MRMLLGLIALVLSSPALAQLNYPPPPTATLATKSEVAAVQAQIPQPSDSVPVPDMATAGQLGSSPRYRRPDDQAPRISRTVSGTSGGVTGGITAADGTVAVTWTTMPSIPKLTITVYTTLAQANKPSCSPVTGTVTVTGATIRCVRQGSVLGLGLLPGDVNVAGVTFDVLALP